MKLLNLGCGQKYHEHWINIDFVSNSPNVQSYNLLKGIPKKDNSIDVVYHSHVLEHFTKDDGHKFIKECFRVLKGDGIIRIAVPDLETIVKEYLKNLQQAMTGDYMAKHNYNWIKLELFDQMVRNVSGGKMKDYLFQPEIPNESFVFSRMGAEGKEIRDAYLNNQKPPVTKPIITNPLAEVSKPSGLIKILKRIKRYITKTTAKATINELSEEQIKVMQIGQFRLGGEIHQWMYDRFSLTELLKEVGFKDIEVCSAFESSIPEWESYNLDVINGEVRKPDSLFIEARK